MTNNTVMIFIVFRKIGSVRTFFRSSWSPGAAQRSAGDSRGTLYAVRWWLLLRLVISLRFDKMAQQTCHGKQFIPIGQCF